MVRHDFRHLFVDRLHHRPDFFAIAALVLLGFLQLDTTVPGQRQRDMVPAGRFISGVSHFSLFNNCNPGSATTNIHHAGVIELQQIRHRGWFVEDMAHFKPGRLQHVNRDAWVSSRWKRGCRMGKTATQLLFERIEMATNDGHRTKEIPDDAIAHDIGPVQANRDRLSVTVHNHRHHITRSQINAQPQR